MSLRSPPLLDSSFSRTRESGFVLRRISLDTRFAGMTEAWSLVVMAINPSHVIHSQIRIKSDSEATSSEPVCERNLTWNQLLTRNESAAELTIQPRLSREALHHRAINLAGVLCAAGSKCDLIAADPT